MSRSVNIVIVILAIISVIIVGLLHVTGLLDGLRETPAEWVDCFTWDDRKYFNSYNILDRQYIDRELGAISNKAPRNANASDYVLKNGEAVYLPVGSKIYSIIGFDRDNYVAVNDSGDFFLYYTSDSSPNEVIKHCKAEPVRENVNFISTPIDTVCQENSEYGVRINVLKKSRDLKDYLSRYVNDFKISDDVFTYTETVDARNYDDKFFRQKSIIAIRVPEDDGINFFNVDSISSDKYKITIHLKDFILPSFESFEKCRVRHFLIEIDADDYIDQKLSYQLERVEIDTIEDASSPDFISDINAVITPIECRNDAIGTPYENIVSQVYPKEFFDDNMLIFVKASDNTKMYDYAFDNIEYKDNMMVLNVNVSPRKVKSNGRGTFFFLTLPKKYYQNEIILLSFGFSEYIMDSESIPCDVSVVSDRQELISLKSTYCVREDLYDDDFFDSYVLLFIGDISYSDSFQFRYRSIIESDDTIEILIDELVPIQYEYKPCMKYAAIPYLKSEWNNRLLRARIQTRFETQEIKPKENEFRFGFFSFTIN